MAKKKLANSIIHLTAVTALLTANIVPSVIVLAEDTQSIVPSGGFGGADTATFDYSGTYSGTLTADATQASSDGKVIDSNTASTNTALAKNAGTLTLKDATLTKSGDDSDSDSANFYGINSILLAVNSGSKAYVSDASLSATSLGSNGIFSTDSATVYANNTKISTSSDNSRGLDATYGGNIIANNMTISTQGQHSGGLATDRGGGNVSVTNSDIKTSGSGSPLLYSTGNIQVDNVTGTATGSQIAGMEGLNTIMIYNSNLTSTITGATASDPIADGIILYQSTSGDAETTTGETANFKVSNSTLSSSIESGAMFYVTNTTANVVLSDSTLKFDTDKANLMTIAGNDSNNWGDAGSNGATVTFTGLDQKLNGNIDVDTISSLNYSLLKGTTYTGSTKISTNSVNTSPSTSPITVNIDKNSSWVVTGDSTVSNLNAESGAKIVDKDGKTVTIIANGKTVVKGTSSYTITVTGSYTNTVTTSDSNTLSTSYIDRSDFDSHFGTSTSFSTNKKSSSKSSSPAAAVSSNKTETSNNQSTILWTIGVLGAIAVWISSWVLIKKNKK